MNLLEIWEFLKVAGLPGIIAMATGVFFWLYLRSERSAAPDPPWLSSIVEGIAQVEDSIKSGLQSCHRRSDEVDNRLREQSKDITEIKTTVGIIAARHE